MAYSNTASIDELNRLRQMRGEVAAKIKLDDPHIHASAVSWGAIFAGAAAAAALSLILLILGTGLGLSSVSPWARAGVTSTTLGFSTIAWLTFTQLASSALGGYLAGRLRTRWIGAHMDEVYFRDTAHGFLAWAVASLATAALLSSVIGTIVGGGVQAAATVTGGAAKGAVSAIKEGVSASETGGSGSVSEVIVAASPMAYFVDSLFRRDITVPNTPPSVMGDALAGEVTRILLNTIQSGALDADDARYIAQIVSRRTGLNQQDAEKRVADVYAKAQAKMRAAELAATDAADKARKAAAYASLWLFISLLIGAFVASWSATYGGRRRDI
jgi:hypothetical protein